MKKQLTALLLVCMLVGCAHTPGKPTIIQTVDTRDIFIVPTGATVHIPAGTHAEWRNEAGELKAIKDWFIDTDIVVTKNGRFISDFLLEDIAQTENP